MSDAKIAELQLPHLLLILQSMTDLSAANVEENSSDDDNGDNLTILGF